MKLPLWLAHCFGTAQNRKARRSQSARKTGRGTRRLRPHLEVLEDRLTPATFSEAGATLNLNLGTTGEQVGIVSNGTSYTLSLTGGTWVGTNTARVTGNGTTTLSVTTAGLAAFNLVNITDSAQNTAVNFNNSGANAYSDSFTVTLDNDTSVSVSEVSVLFSGTSAFGASNLTVNTTRNIQLDSGAGLTTTSGNINFQANAGGSTAGDFSGILVNGATIQVTGSGTLTVKGWGGSGTAANHGVRVTSGGDIIGGTSGLVTVEGTSGTGTTVSGTLGVSVFGSTSSITSNGANVSVTGTGAATGTSSDNIGITVSGGLISAGGSGTVNVTGTGGLTTFSGNIGLRLTSNGTITSSGGNVTVSGTGRGTGAASLSAGLFIDAGFITAGGTGTVSLTGQGGTSTGGSNHGIWVLNSGVVTSGGGNVIITGISGSAPLAAAIRIGNGGGGSVTTATNGGSITFIADTMDLTTSSSINAGSGTVTLRQRTNNQLIGLGAADSATTLGLTDGELDLITAGTLRIGDANSGAITVSATISRPGGVFSLQSGSTVTENAGAAITVSGNALAVRAGGAIILPQSNQVTDFAAVTTSGGITYAESSAGGALSINDVDGVAGVSTNNAAINLSTTSGNFTVTNTTAANDIDAGTSTVSITVGAGNSLTMNNNTVVRGTGGITFTVDDMSIGTTGTNINAGTATASFLTKTAGRAIDLGTDTAGTLGLTDAELDRVTAGLVQIGNATSGIITVSAAITHGNNLSLTTGAGITANQSLTMAADKNLTANATGTISFANANADFATSGTGALALTTAKNISLVSGSSITTVNGNINLQANTAGTTTGNFVGIDINNATVQVTGTGTLTLVGRGGTDSGGSQIGVLIGNGADVIGGTSGLVSVTGTGGANAGFANNGVMVSDAGSQIISSGAAVTVTGTGGGGASVTSDFNYGVLVQSSGKISAGNTGAVTVTGTGGVGTGGSNFGIIVSNATITSGGGNLQVTGTEGTGANSVGINVSALGVVNTAINGGDTTLISDSMSFDASANVGAQNILTLRQRINGVAINLGTATDTVGGPLGLSDAELDRASAPTVQIGNANSGTITVSAALTLNNNLSLTTGASILFNQSVTMVAVPTSLTANAVGLISLATANSDLAANGSGSISLTSLSNISLATGSSITTANGDITLQANVAGTGTTSSTSGIRIFSGTVSTTGGNISMTGRGSTSIMAGTTDSGIELNGATITGAGNGKSLTLTGVGTPTFVPSSYTADGLGIINSTISTTGANISLTGTRGVQTIHNDIAISGTSNIQTAGSGTIVLNVDNFIIAATASINSGPNTTFFRQRTAGTAIDVGSTAGVTSSLNLSDAELDRVTAGILQIGDANSGNITVSAAIDTLNTNVLSLTTGGAISQSAGATITEGNLRVAAAGAISLTQSNQVGTLAGSTSNAAANFDYTDADALTLGTVAGTSGITTTNGTITITSGGAMTISNDVTAGTNGSVFLTANTGDMAVNANVRSNAAGNGTGTLNLVTTNGNMTTNGSGLIQATGINGTALLRSLAAGTSIGTLANPIRTDLDRLSAGGGGANISIFLTELGAVNLFNSGSPSLRAGTGTVTLAGGTYIVVAADQVDDATNLVVNFPATFSVNGQTETIGSLAGSGLVNLGASGNLTTGNATNTTFGGSISNTGASLVVKQGAGTFTLTGINTYLGSLNITGGILEVAATGKVAADVRANSGGTLAGTGTITGQVTNTNASGTVSPGAAAGGAGTLNTGNLVFPNAATFKMDVNGTGAGQFDQLNVTGTVNLTNVTLSLQGGYVVAPGDTITLINNDGAEAITGTFVGLAEGAVVSVGGFVGRVSYIGGSGNDVVLKDALETSVTLDGSNNLIISDINTSTNDNLKLSISGSQYRIEDLSGGFLWTNIAGATGSGTSVVLVNTSAVTGTKIHVNTLTGNDTLTVDYSGGNFGLALQYDAGSGGTDVLTLSGGTFATVTHAFINDTDGSVAITGNGLLSYTGLDPINDNLLATNRVFDFIGGAETISVTDTGGGDGKTKISSTLGESVNFTNPTVSLKIQTTNGTGADTINVTGVDAAYNASFTVTGDGDDTFNLSAALTLATNNTVDVTAGQINLPATTSDITVSGTGGVTFTAARNIALASGSSINAVNGNISLTANSAGTATGTFVGIDVNGSTVQVTGTGLLTLQGQGGNSGASQVGVSVSNTGTVSGGTSGLVSLTGTGGSGSTGNHGVLVTGANSKITSTGGTIQVTGIEGAGTNSLGINVITNGLISTASGSTITLIGDSMNFDSTSSISTGTGVLNVRQRTNGVALNLGTATDVAGGPLGLSDAELNRFTAGTLRLGDANSGAITISADLNFTDVPAIGIVRLTSGSTVTATAGGIVVTNLAISAGGTINFTDATTNAVTLAAVSASGNITYVDAVNLTVTTVDGFAGVDANSGSVNLVVTAGFLTVANTAAANDIDATTGITITLGDDVQLFTIAAAADVETTGGDIILSADGMNLLGTVTANTVAGQNVTLRSNQAGDGINIGSTTDSSTNTLGLSDAELDRVAVTGAITIGRTDAAATSTIGITAAIAHAGDDHINVLSGKNIIFSSAASWTTATGNLYFEANKAGTMLANLQGISLTNASITSTGTGSITLNGTGGNAAGTDFHMGIQLLSGAVIQATGAGAISLTGKGGSGAAANYGIGMDGAATKVAVASGKLTLDGTGGTGTHDNFGILLNNGATLSSSGGDIQVDGTGGTGTDTINIGINISAGSSVQASGAANVTLNGTGGTGTLSQFGVGIGGAGTKVTVASGKLTINGTGGKGTHDNFGVILDNTALVSSSGGAINILGTGGAGSDSINYGIFMLRGADVTATSAATITFNGIGGGAGGSSIFNHGIFLTDAGTNVTSASGAIQFTGTPGVAANSVGIVMQTSANVSSTGSTVSFIADSMILDIGTPTISAAGNIVTLRQLTNDTTINLGGADGAGVLGLIDAELDRITAGTLQIGDANSGNITITAAITRPASTAVNLTTAKNIIFNPGAFNTAGGTLTLASGATGNIQPITSGTDATASNVSFAAGSDLQITIGGAAVDTLYRQLNVNGTVNLAGTDLVLSGAYVPAAGAIFTIVQATSRTGTFNGLNDGDTFLFNGETLQINYTATKVTLTNVTNHSPTDIALSNSSLPENAGANFVIGSLSTTDPDAGDSFTYTLVTGTGDTDNGAFNLAGNQLRANASFDFETQNSFSIRVRTTDAGGLFFEEQFTITVTNVNETPTDLALSNSSLPENAGANFVIGSLSTTDPDAGDSFTYTLVTGTGDTDNGAFNLAGNQLQANASFDFEAGSSYTVRLRTTDAGGLFFEEAFTITVTNVNETPTDLDLSNSSLPENAGANFVIGSLSTTDPDAGDSFTYTFATGTGDADNGAFNLSGNQLRANASFDFETQNSFSIRVRTTDAGGLFFEEAFTITVTNVNETPTNLNLSNSSLPENSGTNAVVGNLSTVDPDVGDTFTYSLVAGAGSTDNGLFNIAGSQLRANASFDFEAGSTYSVRLRTTDAGGLFFEEQFTITITNVNEAPTDLNLSNSSLPENAGVNFVIGSFSTVDPDAGDTFTYSLVAGTGSTDNGAFNVAGNQLRANASFDFETQNSFTVRVRSTDAGGLFFDEVFTITVTNVNETPLLVSSGGPYVINEGGTLNLTATVIDPDVGQTLTITWDVDANGSIDASTTVVANGANQVVSASLTWAQLNALAPPVNDGPALRNLRVRVSDGTVAPFTNTTVTINNVAPIASVTNSGPANEGSTTTTVSFNSPFDPSTVDTSLGFHYAYDFNNDGDFNDAGEIGDGSYAGSSTSAAVLVPATYLTDGPGARTVRMRILDKDGGFTDYTTVITINNVVPVPSISGPGSSYSGTSVTFTGGFTDPAGAADGPYVFTWTVSASNGQLVPPLSGSVATPGAVANFGFTPTAAGTYTVTLTVQEENGTGAVGAVSHTLIVTGNTGPTGPSGFTIDPTSPGLIGNSPHYLAATATPLWFVATGVTDPDPGDQAAGFTYQFDWNSDNNVDAQSAAGQSGTSFTFASSFNVGLYTPRVRAIDQFGNAGAWITLDIPTLEVPTARMVGANLLINGGSGPDAISVNSSSATSVTLVRNGVNYGPFNVSGGRVIIYSGDSSDILNLSGYVSFEVHAGTGNDTVYGGSGDDIIHGDAGDDFITAGNGNDVVIGGLGKDNLQGGNGHDILVGGMVDPSLYPYAALQNVLQAWISNPNNSPPPAGLTALRDATTDPNTAAEADKLTGGVGKDAFIYRASGSGLDTYSDYKVSEYDYLLALLP